MPVEDMSHMKHVITQLEDSWEDHANGTRR